MRKRKVPNTDSSITAVLFRKYRDGEVIALFPYIPGDTTQDTCQSFMHVGQHGAAYPSQVVGMTEPASVDEARFLIVELTSSPYFYPPLRILKRMPRDATAHRMALVRLEYLRGEVDAERISYGELAELQSLARFIDPGDVLLRQWAGLPEFDTDEVR